MDAQGWHRSSAAAAERDDALSTNEGSDGDTTVSMASSATSPDEDPSVRLLKRASVMHSPRTNAGNNAWQTLSDDASHSNSSDAAPTVVVVDDIKGLKQAVHDEMERIGCAKFQRRVVTILGFGNVADAVEVLAIGYILTVYEDAEGKISPWESSFLTAAVFAGMLAGGFFGGIFGDIYGRKPVLLTTLAINAISAFLSAFSTSIYWLIFFRSIAGLGVGGVVSSLFALCLEHVPVSSRGRYVTILCSFWMVGAVVTAGTAWIMLGNDTNGNRILNISWRWFAAVVGLPSLICLFFTSYYVPESAHFLASKGRAQAATEVVQYIHHVHGSDCLVEFRFSEADPPAVSNKPGTPATHKPRSSVSSVAQSTRGSIAGAIFDRAASSYAFGRLFAPSQLKCTLLLMMCAFTLSFGSYGLSTWITKLFETAGLSNPFANAFLFAGANLPGNVISLYLIDIIGRRKLLSGSFFASALCTLLFAFQLGGSATIIVLVSCLFNACTTAAWNAFGVMSTESFPLEVRTTGIAMVNCSNRIGAIVAQFVNGFLVGPPPHLEALLLVTTSVMVLGGVASRFVPNPSDDAPKPGEEPNPEHEDEDKQCDESARCLPTTERSDDCKA
ncbi:TPA: hypothetical protein N0F65_007280 [Lagenidium giganteum]|uniref:Major facilitator superfamily (MFS) profile domain-containing protein n=1 Tax=Lagenidium giganteum TaxID=4803 RepID=A0AAV2Z7W5_9STRA|nr:TPA: hypothetical protein N0F65_007280 [Lagenidium giganteum]